MSKVKTLIFLFFDFNSSNFSIFVPVANILASNSLNFFTIEFPIPDTCNNYIFIFKLIIILSLYITHY